MAYAKRHAGLDIGLALRPIRDMLVFKGRSTRSELVGFWLVSTLANLVIFIVADDTPFQDSSTFAAFGWWLLWDFPFVALLLRRLNDQGRSRKWLAVPIFMVTAMILLALLPEGAHYTITVRLGPIVRHPASTLLSVPLFAVGFATAIFVLLLYLLPGAPGPNRYGPDPRL